MAARRPGQNAHPARNAMGSTKKNASEGNTSQSTVSHYAALQTRDQHSILIDNPGDPNHAIPVQVYTGYPTTWYCINTLVPTSAPTAGK